MHKTIPVIDYLVPLSMIYELLYEVGNVLKEEGEDFRLKHVELLDVYQSLIEPTDEDTV